MPLPGTQPIHPDWSAHHAGVATGTLSGRIVLSGPASGGGWDPISGPTPPTPGPTLYDGAFRAQALASQTDPADAAGQAVTVRSYLLVLDAAAPAMPPGTLARVHTCPDDAALEGKVLRVTGTTFASRRFERDVYADLDLTNQPAAEGA